MGRMSGNMLALAKGQDLIGYRHFMEGRISKKIWSIQSRHLALSAGHMNGTEWTKGFITRILKITQSQWIYRNVSFHDKQHGYAKRKRVDELDHQIRQLGNTNPRNIPQDSRFLLERDSNDLSKDSVLMKEYYVEAIEAAIKAGRRIAAMGKRAKKVRKRMSRLVKRNKILGVFDVMREVREDMSRSGELMLNISTKRKYGRVDRESTAMVMMGSNKRFKPGD